MRKIPFPQGESGALQPGRRSSCLCWGQGLQTIRLGSHLSPGSVSPSPAPRLSCPQTLGWSGLQPVPDLVAWPAPLEASGACLPGRLLGRVWIFGFNNHSSGCEGAAAETTFQILPKSQTKAQTTVGYRPQTFQQQIKKSIRVAALGEADTDNTCALGGRDFSKFNYNVSVKYASSVGVLCLAQNRSSSLSPTTPYDTSVCCKRLIYRLLIG